MTIEDNVNPTVVGQDIIIDLNGNPSISITPEDLDNGSFDNCDYTISIDIDTFTMSGVYDIVLTITDSVNNSTSVTVTVTVTDNTLGVEENSFEIKNIKLYPVPTKDILNIKIPNNIEKGHLKLFDINGKLVMEKELENETSVLSLQNLQDGIYILKITIDNKTISKRVIKSN